VVCGNVVKASRVCVDALYMMCYCILAVCMRVQGAISISAHRMDLSTLAARVSSRITLRYSAHSTLAARVSSRITLRYLTHSTLAARVSSRITLR
jgi:hypothetical protein